MNAVMAATPPAEQAQRLAVFLDSVFSWRRLQLITPKGEEVKWVLKYVPDWRQTLHFNTIIVTGDADAINIDN